MYDLDLDVTTLLDDGDMLAGQRAFSKQHGEQSRTWNITSGITLWNLHHPNIKDIAKKWYKQTVKGLEAKKDHDDQYYLQAVLKEGDMFKQVNGLPIEFMNEQGTVAKQFNRTKQPYSEIERLVKEICEKHPTDCQDLDHAVYTE
jgi:hypothetical protein